MVSRLLLYPGFEVLDVFGPLEALNVISRSEFLRISKIFIQGITLATIAQTMEPVSAALPGDVGAVLGQKFTPDFTIETVPELDVLIIPGGLGSDSVPDTVIEWIKNVFPDLQYLITVCTGADLAARAGLLDGLKATTNKMAWEDITSKKTSHKTYWIAEARWVKSSDKILTTSGISAGTDGMLAWIEDVYGRDIATLACRWMEYNRYQDFAEGLHDVPPTEKV